MKYPNYFDRTKKEVVRLRHNKKMLLLYFFFVGVAMLFWFLHSLGKEYVANVSVDVEYVNFPPDEEPQEATVRRHTLNVRAFGFSLMRMQSNRLFSNYKIDVSRLRSHKLHGGNMLQYDLSISAIQNQFEGQLGDGVSVNSIFPEEVEFKVKEMSVKKVPIRSKLKVEMQSGYMISEDATIQPDSVTVRGARELIDTLQAIYTEAIPLDDVSESFEKKVRLEQPSEKVELSKEYAKVSYKIEEYIDEVRRVEIRALNFPDSLSVTLQPAEVELQYRTYAEAKRSIKAEDFVLVVDYNTLNDFSKKLEVQPINLPEGISKVHMTPRYVNYVISHKK